MKPVTKTEKAPILPMLIADLRGRKRLGVAKYGAELTVATNGRDPLQDAYEEALDLCFYLRQEIARRKAGLR